MFNTNILRLSAGPINQINDTLPGGGGGNIGPQVGLAPGQAGAGFWLDDSNLIYASSVGTVYGGHFRYVQLHSGAGTPVVGQIAFWYGTTETESVVTTAETGSSPNALFRAGIFLNAITPGNYGVIQDVGPVYCKFINPITEAASLFVYAAGDGSGLCDTLGAANPATDNSVAIFQNRFIGAAFTAPTNGSLTLVNVNLLNVRG